MASQKDYYETLGVKTTATVDDVRKAYRKLAFKNHPDRNAGDKEAERRFREASNAYEVLHDPKKRAAYDSHGRAGVEDMGFRGFSSAEDIFSNFGDIFGDLFGGRTPRGRGFRSTGARFGGRSARAPRRGNDLAAEIRIPFLESLSGGKRSLKLAREKACPACAGSGDKSGGLCPGCGGRGVVPGHATIEVKIPAGIDDGSVLRLAGQGAPGTRGGPAGDLLITLRVEPHADLRREGSDLRARVTIPLATALLGGKVEAPTAKGTALLTVPAGTQPGDVLRMAGLGVSFAGRTGDELVEITVELPGKLTPKQKELVEKLRDELARPDPPE